MLYRQKKSAEERSLLRPWDPAARRRLPPKSTLLFAAEAAQGGPWVVLLPFGGSLVLALARTFVQIRTASWTESAAIFPAEKSLGKKH